MIQLWLEVPIADGLQSWWHQCPEMGSESSMQETLLPRRQYLLIKFLGAGSHKVPEKDAVHAPDTWSFRSNNWDKTASYLTSCRLEAAATAAATHLLAAHAPAPRQPYPLLVFFLRNDQSISDGAINFHSSSQLFSQKRCLNRDGILWDPEQVPEGTRYWWRLMNIVR